MLTIRVFEEHVNELYTTAQMPGLAHLYIGEEAVAVGVCEALRRDDYITSTHRGHGHCLAKGAAIDRMFAELLGKEAGLLPRQGRLDAHRRPADRQPRRKRHRRRQRRASRRAPRCRRSGGARPGRGLLLRRGRARPGPAVRGDEHGVALEAAGRSTSARTTSTASTRTSRRRPPATSGRAPRPSASPPETVDGQDVRAVHAAARRCSSSARAAATARRFLVCKTYRCTATTSAMSTAPTTAQARRRRPGDASAIRSTLHAALAARAESRDRGDARRGSRGACRLQIETGGRVRAGCAVSGRR